MGREVRRVPENWKHPTIKCSHRKTCSGGRCFQPIYNRSFKSASEEWKREFIDWENGVPPKYAKESDLKKFEYWEWNGDPPKREYYRPYESDGPWFQVYETVSEGTPVTPAFSTAEELIDHLVNVGDDYDGIWSRESAEHFLKSGCRASMIINGGKIYGPKDQNLVLPEKKANQ